MPRSVVLIACLLAIAAALSTWFWWPRTVALPNYDISDNQTAAPGDPESDDTVGNSPHRVAAPTAADAGAISDTHALKVQLRGLHRDAPWTEPLHIELKDRGRGRMFGEFEGSAPVTAEGRCDLPLPKWWQPGIPVAVRIQGGNTGYRELTHRNKGNLSLHGVLALDVQATVKLTGKVTDSHGEAVANARVSAFAMQAGQPYGKSVGSAGSNERGEYLLRAPPDVPLMIIATAMQPNGMRWRLANGITDNNITDNGQLRGDLLPATLPVQLAVNYPGSECNFTLKPAAKVSGAVQWPNGEPVAGARVQFGCAEGNQLELSANAEIRWQMNGSMVACGITTVDRHGHFSIPASAGAELDLQVVAANDLPIIGELSKHRVVAPVEQMITLPFPVDLRAIHEGQLVPYARILMHGRPPLRARADGTRTALIATDAMVRAEQGALRSPWQSIASSQLEQTVDFHMANELAALHVEFEGEFPIRNAAFHWQCKDGRKQTERLQRGDSSGPFEIWLEPGDYELRVEATDGERNGTYLLPITRNFNIRQKAPTGPALRLDLPAKFGGTFVMHVLDDKGQFLGGKLTVRDSMDKDRLVRMTGDGKPGTFPAERTTCQDVLPPGPYELIIDLGAKGVHRRYVVIKARETSPVALRL